MHLFLRRLRTLKGKVLVVISITSAVSLATHIGVKQAFPLTYRGDMKLLVEPITTEAKTVQIETISSVPESVPSQDYSHVDYATQIEVLQSPLLLAPILEEIRTQYPTFSLEEFKKGLTIQRLHREQQQVSSPTKIIDVRFQGKDPEQVQFILDKTAKGYIEYGIQAQKANLAKKMQFVDTQLPRLQKRVDMLRSRRQELQERYNLNAPNVQQSPQFPAIARENDELQQQLKIANQTFEQVLTLREQLQLEAAQNNGSWQIISPPKIPRDATGNLIPAPNPSTVMMFGGIVLGLSLGAGTTVLLERR